MRRNRTEEIHIGPGMPENLRFLLTVPPVPSESDARCSGPGVCAAQAWSGVSCGALFGKCSLLPMKSKATESAGLGAEETNGFSEYVAGLKSRHPELFVHDAKADSKMAAAGDDWDGAEPEPEVTEVLE